MTGPRGEGGSGPFHRGEPQGRSTFLLKQGLTQASAWDSPLRAALPLKPGASGSLAEATLTPSIALPAELPLAPG